MRISDVFLGRACASINTIASISTTRAQCWSRIHFVSGVRACGDHSNLIFARKDRPISALRTDDLYLLEQVGLVPAKADLSNPVILIKVNKMCLVKLAMRASLQVFSAYYW